MSRDVLLRKLAYLRQLLNDLAPYQTVSLTEVISEHYKIERLLELLVATATDILFHLLTEKDKSPDSYRDAFKLASDEDILSPILSQQLQQAAGMRNILVHLYEDIDYAILRDSIAPAWRDF
ncbi:MAG: DUF86 domain-containing protein, partial [Anaerolineae bacterium]